MGHRSMKHEAVARDLVRRTVKFAAKRGEAKEVEVVINMVSFYICLNGDKVEFWSAEKCCEFPISATEEEMYRAFLNYLNKAVSKDYLIEYIT